MNFDDCQYQVSGVFDTIDFCGAVPNEDGDKGEMNNDISDNA